jgi:hypothetical protein
MRHCSRPGAQLGSTLIGRQRAHSLDSLVYGWSTPTRAFVVVDPGHVYDAAIDGAVERLWQREVMKAFGAG